VDRRFQRCVKGSVLRVGFSRAAHCPPERGKPSARPMARAVESLP
jgi:hypothetical protein